MADVGVVLDLVLERGLDVGEFLATVHVQLGEVHALRRGGVELARVLAAGAVELPRLLHEASLLLRVAQVHLPASGGRLDGVVRVDNGRVVLRSLVGQPLLLVQTGVGVGNRRSRLNHGLLAGLHAQRGVLKSAPAAGLRRSRARRFHERRTAAGDLVDAAGNALGLIEVLDDWRDLVLRGYVR